MNTIHRSSAWKTRSRWHWHARHTRDGCRAGGQILHRPGNRRSILLAWPTALAACGALEVLQRFVDTISAAGVDGARVAHRKQRRPEAIVAIEKAGRLQPTLPRVWLNLAALLDAVGDRSRAATAYLLHARSGMHDPELLAAGEALSGGRLPDAESMLRDRLRAFPTDIAAAHDGRVGGAGWPQRTGDRAPAALPGTGARLCDGPPSLRLDAGSRQSPQGGAGRAGGFAGRGSRQRRIAEPEGGGAGQAGRLRRCDPPVRIDPARPAQGCAGLDEPGPRAENGRPGRTRGRGLPARAGDRPRFWQRLVEPGQSQDRPFRRARWPPCRRSCISPTWSRAALQVDFAQQGVETTATTRSFTITGGQRMAASNGVRRGARVRTPAACPVR